MFPLGGDVKLEDRVKQQFPALFITLLSVLVGLDFADLVDQAHSRMVLWPLDLGTLRTWAQIFAMGSGAFGAWVTFAHVAIARQSIPSFADSVIVFLIPVPLLIGNSLIGLKDIWPWLYAGSLFMAICLGGTLWHFRLAHSDDGLVTLNYRFRQKRDLLLFGAGVAVFAALAWADRRGFLSPLAEVIVAASPTPVTLFCAHLFFRDWRQAIIAAS